MSTDLVPAAQALDFAGQANLLRQAQAQVRAAAAPEAENTAEQARLVREWLKVVKGSADLALEATRLECEALRRLAQLNAEPKGIKGSAGRYFAELSDAGFADLMQAAKPWSGALGVMKMVRELDSDRRAIDYGRALAQGEHGVNIPMDGERLRELAQAAGALLGHYSVEGRPFSMTEIAEELGDQFLGEWGGRTWCREPLVREGLVEVVRQAIQLEAHASDGPDDHPEWVTYYEDRAGWVRIPWRLATLEQFRFMVELRWKQADDLQAIARRLSEILTGLEATAKTWPDGTSLHQLWLDTPEPEQVAS